MKVASIFSEHMVFPANKPIRVFGEADGNVEIEFLEERYSAMPVQGKWEIVLPAMPYGGPYCMRIRGDGEEKTFADIMVGEVILIAGQSNLQFTIENEGTELGESNGQLRFFVSDRMEEYEGIKSKDGWVLCEAGTVEKWSAVGFYLARKLQMERGVTVGVVGCYQGASNIQSWLPKKVANETRFYVSAEEAHWDFSAELYAEWNQAGKLFEKTFLPIAPYAFSAVVWYQGESNTSVAEGKIYADMVQALAESWRSYLKNAGLPFIIVQICDFDDRRDAGWRAIQNAQVEAVRRMDNAWLVTSSDVCEHFDIHPPKKQALGEKVAKVLCEIL